MPNTLLIGRVISISNGRRPSILLNSTLKMFNEDRLKIEGGIVPDNVFWPTEKKQAYPVGQKIQGYYHPSNYKLEKTFLVMISFQNKMGWFLSYYFCKEQSIGALTRCQVLWDFSEQVARNFAVKCVIVQL